MSSDSEDPSVPEYTFLFQMLALVRDLSNHVEIIVL